MKYLIQVAWGVGIIAGLTAIFVVGGSVIEKIYDRWKPGP